MVNDEPDHETKSQRLQKAVNATSSKLCSIKRDPSNIFKTFSQSYEKSDLGFRKGFAKTAAESENLQSVRDEVTWERF